MRFQLEWGEHLKKLEKLVAQGVYVQALEEAPELNFGDAFVWEMYSQLCASRTPGSPIKLTEILAWLDLNAVTDLNERLELTELVRALDLEFMSWMKERADTKSDHRRPGSEGGSGPVGSGH